MFYFSFYCYGKSTLIILQIHDLSSNLKYQFLLKVNNLPIKKNNCIPRGCWDPLAELALFPDTNSLQTAGAREGRFTSCLNG